jgi:tRNA/rRNA methyltransferase
MFTQMSAALAEIGFLNEQNPEEIMHALRRMLGRAAMDVREVSILRGILRQIQWASRQERKPDPCD